MIPNLPNNSSSNSVGKKNDDGKLRFDLLPPEFEEAVTEVLTYGAKKYGENNWKQVENATERYYAALRRHLNAWRQGEISDPESGLDHLAHVATNVLFLMYFEGNNGGHK